MTTDTDILRPLIDEEIFNLEESSDTSTARVVVDRLREHGVADELMDAVQAAIDAPEGAAGYATRHAARTRFLNDETIEGVFVDAGINAPEVDVLLDIILGGDAIKFKELRRFDPIAAKAWWWSYEYVREDPFSYDLADKIFELNSIDVDPQSLFDGAGAVFVPGGTGEWVAWLDGYLGAKPLSATSRRGPSHWFYFNSTVRDALNTKNEWCAFSVETASGDIPLATEEQRERIDTIWEPFARLERQTP